MALHQDHYRFSVIDNGPGIDKAYQPFLFNKFTQEQSALTRETGGTGLGLAITKGFVEQLNGKISFATTPDAGTTFFVDLPIQKIPAVPEPKRMEKLH